LIKKMVKKKKQILYLKKLMIYITVMNIKH
jgi:hypothetical protein